MDHLPFYVPLAIVAVIVGAIFFTQQIKKATKGIDGVLQRAGKNQIIPVPLIRRVQESHDVVSLTFGLPKKSDILGIGIGEHIKCHELVDGDEIERKYTPVSTVDTKGEFTLLIKVYSPLPPRFPKGGIYSQFVDNIKVNDKIKISGPIGRFNYHGNGSCTIKNAQTMVKTSGKFKKICMVAGGTGITPCYQVIHAIASNPKDKTELHILFANKTEEDIIMRKELEAWKEKGKLNLNFTVDTPPQNWSYFSGFITKDMLEKAFPSTIKDNLFVSCGPPIMNNMLLKQVKELGYTDENIFQF